MTGKPRPRDSVLSAHMEREAVLLEMDRRRYFKLNETGQSIWRALEAGATRAEVVDRLVTEYEVEPDMAAQALDRFLADLTAHHLVEGPQPS